jgi:synaptobrevin family protein YKT6
MKVYSLSVVLAPPSGPSSLLSSASDLSSFSFYQKGSVGEFLTFFSKTVAERTPQGQRQSVQENNYTAHVYNRGGAEQLAGQARTWIPCRVIGLTSFFSHHYH